MTDDQRKLSRSGSRRLGDDYQDLIAIDILIDWLEHKERYNWVKVEADDAFSLDDVTAQFSDNSYLFKQVKFSTHPDNPTDPYSWETFLYKGKGSNGNLTKSLLEKWSASVQNLSDNQQIKDASLVSNRRAAPDVAVALTTNGLIDFDKIAEQSIRDSIIQQIGGEIEARFFFSQFHFHLNEPNLDEFVEGLRKRFFRLGGTENGWHELTLSVGNWVVYKNLPTSDGKITLDEVKRAARWHELKALPQDFTVPPDYVLPSERFHEELVTQLTQLGQGSIVMKASPGMGKSTYSSFLFHDLVKKKVPVVRHHYFLAIGDRFSSARFDHLQAAESIMHDLLYQHSEALERLANQNPNPHQLREWIEACGTYYSAQGKAFIVIIDGLDHVWREKRSIGELEKLLGFFLPIPQGVVVFLATQPVDDEKLPNNLLRAAPRSQWHTLPHLDRTALGKLLEFHRSEMGEPGNDDIPDFRFTDLVEAFYKKSSGHPLYLHYSLQAILEQKLIFTEEVVNELPGCPHADIVSYYEELWRLISEESRQILYLMSTCRFPWPKKGLLDCLDPGEMQTPRILDALKRVDHLLISDELGLKPFHSSLLTFIESQDDYSLILNSQRRKVLIWLQSSAPTFWRWAYEWILEAQLGNITPLLNGPSRQWTIEAIAFGRPYKNIIEILSQAIRQSLDIQDLPRAIELGLFLEYCNNAFDYQQDTLEKLMYPQLITQSDHYFRSSLLSDLDQLSNGEVALLAEKETLIGNISAVKRCLQELGNRFRRYNSLPVGERLTWEEQNDSFLMVAALEGNVSKRIINYAVRSRASGKNQKILKRFAENLRFFKSMEQLREISRNFGNNLTQTSAVESADNDNGPMLTREEFSIILRNIVLLALEEGQSIVEIVLGNAVEDHAFSIIYAVIAGIDNFQPREVAFPNATRLTSKKDYDDNNFELREFFYQCFFCFLANWLTQSGQLNGQWIQHLSIHQWLQQFLHKLDQIAQELGNIIIISEPYSLGSFYDRLKVLKRPEWSNDENSITLLGYGRAAVAAATNISLDLIILLKANGNTQHSSISSTDFKALIESDYFFLEDWLATYISRRRPFLTEDALADLFRTQQQLLNSTIDHFTSRASLYSILAAVAGLHSKIEQATFFTLKASENLIAHYNHKDMLFFGVLESIQIFHNNIQQKEHQLGDAEVSDPPTRNWLLQLAPAIAKVEEYTDTDETGGLPRELADVLSDVAIDLLPDYYRWLANQEEFYDALSTLHIFLKKADLSDPINFAIATTATDRESLIILSNRSQSGDTNSETALSELKALLGQNTLNSERGKDYETTSDNSNPERVEVLPDISSFEPDRFEDYLEELKAKSIIYNFDKAIQNWIDLWIKEGKRENVYEVLNQIIERGVYFRQLDLMYTLADKLYGKERAYQWLVAAHSEDFGWQRYYTAKSKAIKRWEIVKKVYPEKWFDFIRDTLIYGGKRSGIHLGSGMFTRLTEYCLFMDKPELAEKVINQMVKSSLEMVSPLSFPKPEWIEEFALGVVNVEERVDESTK